MKIGMNIKQEDGEWICDCGNEPAKDGFNPCDARGEEMEPLKDIWPGFYICGRCGAMFNIEGMCVREPF